MGHLDGYGHECDACGALIYDRFRTRHSDCAAPRLPDEFYMARERARASCAAVAHTDKETRSDMAHRCTHRFPLPSWMGKDQDEPCRCDLPWGHEGAHSCSHLRASGQPVTKRQGSDGS